MRLKNRRRTLGLCIFFAVLIALILLWDWNWFRPLVQAEASAAAGRKVTLGHFDVHLSRSPQIVLDRIAVANPAKAADDAPSDFPENSNMATVDRLAIRIRPWALFHRNVNLTEVEIDRPRGDLKSSPNGQPNWQFGDPKKKAAPAPSPWKIDVGTLVINDGNIHFVDTKLKSDFTLTVHTEPTSQPAAPTSQPGASEAQIVVGIEGTYSAQPISGRFVGGSVLGLRDPSNPYSVDLKLANGPTKVSLQGTLLEPTRFGGADLKLDLQGNDLAALYPLTGIPLAPTPPYHLSGQLDYAARKIRFEDFAGTVGSSDLSGNLTVDMNGARPLVTADMSSKKVVLADLAGFIGSPPGKADAANESAKQKKQHAQQDANPRLLPDTPINLPKLRSADLDVKYKAVHIESNATPLDNIVTHLQVQNGNLSLEPLSFAVGTGSIVFNVKLDGQDDQVHAVADVDFRQVALSRIMQSTKLFEGAGIIGGNAKIDTTGNSLAKMLGDGDGELKLFMSGGNLSSLLVDLAGLDFGNGVLSALGVPSKAALRCMVTDFGLNKGQVDTKVLLFDTSEANITGTGTVDLTDEKIDYKLATEPKHFNIGSLPAPILIRGPLKNPSILPDPKALALRGGAAIALGIVATPLAALIPTIQLGLGKDHNCDELLKSVETAAKIPPGDSSKKIKSTRSAHKPAVK